MLVPAFIDVGKVLYAIETRSLANWWRDCSPLVLMKEHPVPANIWYIHTDTVSLLSRTRNYWSHFFALVCDCIQVSRLHTDVCSSTYERFGPKYVSLRVEGWSIACRQQKYLIPNHRSIPARLTSVPEIVGVCMTNLASTPMHRACNHFFNASKP